ncbi:hypothetical protein HPG69_006565, partial [Diceros bicornis minor]
SLLSPGPWQISSISSLDVPQLNIMVQHQEEQSCQEDKYKLIGCYVGNITEDVVLVRIYGNKSELLVDETRNNELCYKFIQEKALDRKCVCNSAIFRLITHQLAKIQAIHAYNGWILKSNLWPKMEDSLSRSHRICR